jgi:hypothetical protein
MPDSARSQPIRTGEEESRRRRVLAIMRKRIFLNWAARFSAWSRCAVERKEALSAVDGAQKGHF